MAVVAETNSINVSLKLNAGTDPEGNMIVKSTGMPGLAPNASNSSIYSVATALAPMLEYPIARVQKTTVCTLSDSD